MGTNPTDVGGVGRYGAFVADLKRRPPPEGEGLPSRPAEPRSVSPPAAAPPATGRPA